MWVNGNVGGFRIGSRNRWDGGWSAQRLCALELSRASGTEEAVVADLGRAFGQNVLKESVDKLRCGKPNVADFPGLVVTVAESNNAVVKRLQAAIRNDDAEDIAGEIVEHLVTAAGMLGVNNPACFPNGGGSESKKSRLLESGTKFGAKDDGEGRIGNQEERVLGMNPRLAIRRQTSGGDEHMDVRMKQHRTCPGVKNGQNADACAEILRIGRQFLQGIGSGLHEQAVDFLRVRASQWPEFGG
jgi:hypothetical protein